MKIEIELSHMQKLEIYRHMLVNQYKDSMTFITTYDDNISKEALLESLKNLIYWNSPDFMYQEFLDSIKEESND